MKLSIHANPKKIKDKIMNLSIDQFGYDGFGLKQKQNIKMNHKFKSKLNFYINNYF